MATTEKKGKKEKIHWHWRMAVGDRWTSSASDWARVSAARGHVRTSALLMFSFFLFLFLFSAPMFSFLLCLLLFFLLGSAATSVARGYQLSSWDVFLFFFCVSCLGASTLLTIFFIFIYIFDVLPKFIILYFYMLYFWCSPDIFIFYFYCWSPDIFPFIPPSLFRRRQGKCKTSFRPAFGFRQTSFRV